MPRKVVRDSRYRAVVLWTVGAFVFIQLALGFAIDVSLPQVRDPEFVHREKLLQASMAREPEKTFVVAIGSSRVFNGLDAATATETLNGGAVVFNFGIPASGPFMERITLERLRRLAGKPDVLLIEMLPALLNGTRTPRDQSELDGARLSAAELTKNRPSWAALSGPIRKWLTARALPVYRHQAELRSLLPIDPNRDGEKLHDDLRSVDPFGWQPRSFPVDRREGLKGLAHRQYDASYRDFRLDDTQVAHLEELLSRCERDGIRTALILMPEGSEFRRLYSPEMNAAIEAVLAHFRERFGAPIIDARSWMDDSHFYDMHHLLPEGAREFSAKLAKEGIAPILKEKPSFAVTDKRH